MRFNPFPASPIRWLHKTSPAPSLLRRRPRGRSARTARLGVEPLEQRLLLANWSGDVFDSSPGTPLWTNAEVQHVVGNVHVPAGKTLTVQPGTVVQFNGNTNLTVDGTLTAVGSSGQSIFFTSYRDNSPTGGANNAGAGDWGAITINSGSSASVLDHTEVRYGGFSGATLLGAIIDSGPLTLSNSVVRDSYSHGLRIAGSAPTVTGDTFQTNRLSAVSMDLAAHPAISGVTLTNNALNGVRLDSGVLPASITWDNAAIVYVIPGDVTVPAGLTLTIGAGQVIKNAGYNLKVDGSLKSLGTTGLPVIFTSYNDDSAGGDTNNNGNSAGGAGDWGAIIFNPGSDASSLDHVVINYGGYSGSVPAAVVVGANITISNSTISNSYYSGMRINGSSPMLTNDTWQNNTVSGTAAISMDLASSPVFVNPKLSGNRLNAVLLDSGSLPANATWNGGGIVYDFSGDVTVPAGKTLTIAAGQVIKGYGRNLIVNGTLHATGTTASPVVFTSFRDDTAGGDTNNDGNSAGGAGDWGAIQFNPGSDASSLDHAVVRYGGYSGVVAAAVMVAANVSISNSTIRDSYNGGVYIKSSNPTLINDAFLDNVDRFSAPAYAVRMDLASHPVITNPILQGNDINGVLLDSGDLPASNSWDNPAIVYQLSDHVTVPAGMTLTVAPGQVIKFGNNHQGGIRLLVSGTLHAAGTAASPIIFTSYMDDTAGGDTNSDGGLYAPGAGDLGAIEFASGSSGNVMDHTEVRYGGYADAAGDVGEILNRGSLTLSNSIVRDSSREGVLVTPTGSATLTSNLIVNTNFGVRAQAGSTLTAVNNTIDNYFHDGIVLDSPTAILTNNLITNSATLFGTGIRQTGPTNLTMRFNDVFNPGSTSNYSGLADATGMNGNVSVDPKYFSRANLSYQLRPGSPVEDAGTSSGAPAADLFSNPRFDDPNISGRGDGSGYDMGAIEVQQVATSTIDLAAIAVSGPTTGVQDLSVTVNWTVQSIGNEAAKGSWHDAVYLSFDSVWTPDDVFLGDVAHNGDLGSGQTYTASGVFTLPGVLPGDYYFLLRANNRNEVFEATALINNITASSSTIATDLSTLTPGIPMNGQLPATGAAKFYKVTATAGRDLQVQLTGSSGATNELYVLFGDIPSRQAFDQRSIVANSANQSVAVPSTQSGLYYIEVFATNLSNAENFTLTASQMAFGVANVTPGQGSNTGQVTLTIAGAQFDGNTTARLIDSSNNTINATKVYYVDSAHIAATFDLTGHPVGPADVQIVNTGNVTTSMPHGFSIIAGQPGRLSTAFLIPSQIRLGRSAVGYLNYANVGDTDLYAPLVRIVGTELVGLSLVPHTSPERILQLIAVSSTGPSGVLPPGAVGRIPIYLAATASGDEVLSAEIATFPQPTIDWDGLEPLMRPLDLPLEQWTTLFNQLKVQIGNTPTDYLMTLSRDSSLLPTELGLNYSLPDVFRLEVMKARAATSLSASGRVFLRDRDHPLGNTHLQLRQVNGSSLHTAISLQDGTFLAFDLEPGMYDLQAEGFAVDSPVQITVGPDDAEGAELVTRPEGVLSGTVLLSSSGVPLRGILVGAVAENGTPSTTTSEDNGAYRITGLLPGEYKVLVGGGELAELTLHNIWLSEGEHVAHLNLVLSPAGRITGRVSDSAGNALVGAKVVAALPDGSAAGDGGMASETGEYSLTGLPGGVYAIESSLPGFAPSRLENVSVFTGATSTHNDLSMVRAGSLRGVIVSQANGQPVPFAGVVAQLNGQTVHTAQADSEGAYELRDLAPGGYTLIVGLRGFRNKTTSATVVAGQTSVQPDISLDITGAIQGTVTRASDGKPLSQILVTVVLSGEPMGFTATADDGSYSIPDLAFGQYRVQVGALEVQAIQSQSVTIDVTFPDLRADFAVPVVGEVKGTAWDGDGSTALANVLVSLYQGANLVARTTTDETGEYHFYVLATGSYQLRGHTDDRAFNPSSEFVIAPGADPLIRDLISGSALVVGTVTDVSNGNRLANAVVQFRAPTIEGISTVRTGEDGSYRFLAVTGTTLDVSAAATEFAYATQSLVPGGTSTKVDFALQPGRSVSGVIRDAAGLPINRAVVRVFLPGQPNQVFSTITDQLGRYNITVLGDGTYDLVVSAPGHQTRIQNGIAVSNTPAVFNLDFSSTSINVRGTLTDGSGTPVADAVVLAEDPRGYLIDDAISGPDGSYVLSGLPPGEVHLTASRNDTSPATLGPITLSAGDNRNGVNFVLPPQAFAATTGIVANGGTRSFARSGALDGASFILKSPQRENDEVSLPTLPPKTCARVIVTYRELQRMIEIRDKFYSAWDESVGAGRTIVAVDAGLITARTAVIATKVANLVNFFSVKNIDLRSFMVNGTGRSDLDPRTFTRVLESVKGFLDRFKALMVDTAKVVSTLTEAFRKGKRPAAYNTVDAVFSLAKAFKQAISDFLLFTEQQNTTLGAKLPIISAVFDVLDIVKNTYEGALDLANAYADLDGRGNDVLNAATGYFKAHGESQVLRVRYLSDLNACNSLYNQEDRNVTPRDIPLPIWARGPRIAVSVRAPLDPNDLVGPAGFGPQRFVQPVTFPYEIEFENDPTKATAAAQIVAITNTLDTDFDLSKFQFTGFGFGSHSFTVPAGLAHYQTTIDLRPDGINLLVPVMLDLDPATRVVTARFESLDPLTRLAPDGINDGFLPVDNPQHDGQGYITYTIAPKAALATGTALTNQASIVFDINDPLATPTALNTIDAGGPTSSVTALPASSPATFTLNWSGSDDAGGSGIATYDIFVSDNGGPFTLFRDDTTATSAQFAGEVNHTYGFFSMATDNVGHRQPTPSAAQATTTIVAGPTPAVLSGTVFNDIDGDGVRDSGEQGLADWTVYLDTNRNGTFDQQSFVYTNASSSDAPKSIPDSASITSTLLVSGFAGNLLDLNLTLDITHTFDGDLTAVLISPTGTRVELFGRVGSGGDNFTNTTLDDEASSSISSGQAPFAGSFRPPQSLSAFDGISPNGTWQLQVTDGSAQDVGILNSWSLALGKAAAPEPNTTTDANGDYRFTDLDPGTYRVREIPQARWVQTSANLADIVLAEGQSLPGNLIGNRQDFQGPTVENAQLVTDARGKKVLRAVLRFNEALNATAAIDRRNFALQKLSRRSATDLPISSIQYDPIAQTVTVTPTKSIPVAKLSSYRLVVRGSGTLTDLFGNQFDGDRDGTPGGDYVALASIIGPHAALREATPAAVNDVLGSPTTWREADYHAAAIDELLDRRKLSRFLDLEPDDKILPRRHLSPSVH